MNKKKVILWGSIIAVAMLFLLIVTLSIRAKVRKKVIKACTDGGGTWDKKNKRCVQPAPAPVPTPAPTQSGGGSSSNNSSTTTTWSPNQLAAEISRNLEGWNFMVYTETAEKVLALNDAQLRVLYVYYNKNYAKDYPTITQLFENEWDDGIFSSTYDRVADRFRSIGLN